MSGHFYRFLTRIRVYQIRQINKIQQLPVPPAESTVIFNQGIAFTFQVFVQARPLYNTNYL